MPRRKKLTNKWDLIKIKVLEDEIEYFKSCIQEHDTGHIYTTIDALETRYTKYMDETKPVSEEYKHNNSSIFYEINGGNQIQEITSEIIKILEK